MTGIRMDGRKNQGGSRPQQGKGGPKGGGNPVPKGKPSAGRPHPKTGTGNH